MDDRKKKIAEKGGVNKDIAYKIKVSEGNEHKIVAGWKS